MPPAPPPTLTLRPGLTTVPEIPTPISLPLTGVLPPYLHGTTLYRNGPGRFELLHADGQTQAVRHWFDGYSLVHAFRIDHAGAVTYHSRFTSLPAQRAAAALKSTDAPLYTFGPADPCRSVLGKFMQLLARHPVDPVSGKRASNVNVTLQTVPGKGPLVSRTDANANIVLHPDTLEQQQFFSFGEINPALKGQFSAAHGHLDEHTGEFINFTFDLKGMSDVMYNVFAVDKSGDANVLASFPGTPSYLHSFATTDKYVVMVVWPLHINALKVLWNKSIMDGLHFFEDKRTRFVVISRQERRVVAEYDGPSFYCFHTINAFEKDDAIHIDLCKYKDAEVLDDFLLDNMRNTSKFSPSTLARFSLPHLAAAVADYPATINSVIETELNGRPLELPRINPTLVRKDYRFVYGVSNRDSDPGPFSVIAKVDVCSGERKAWHRQSCVVGEPIFVPDPDSTREDDGVLLVVELDLIAETSAMVVVDAGTMEEIARANVPQAVPLGFHGKFHPPGL